MKGFLFVAFGGAIGAMLRYGISSLPVKSDFPILTLSINLLGAFFIGCIVGYVEEHTNVNKELTLFLQTGVCGGFTTFSTFSLEAFHLFDHHRYGLGISYVFLSVSLCILGVLLGKFISKMIFA